MRKKTEYLFDQYGHKYFMRKMTRKEWVKANESDFTFKEGTMISQCAKSCPSTWHKKIHHRGGR